MTRQPSLFDLQDTPPPAGALPEGLVYKPDLIGTDEEAALAGEIAALPFAPFQFHGYEGARRVVAFGWDYRFARQALEPAPPIPDFLQALRAKVAAVAGGDPDIFQQAMVIEYAPGAGIGWHRDRPQFEVIAGVSLLASCPFRLRRKVGQGWERATLRPAPRSLYILAGPAREDWEHSIPAVEALRYSVTFRTFRPPR
jgi:alkylated DNA repair dioxygenase AlkB